MHLRVLSPASPQAVALLSVWNVCFWVCGLILAVVTIAILYIMIRFRRRDASEPVQTTGNQKIEIAWTIVPILLVTFLFALGVVAARAVDRPIRRAPDILVIGHQWWWEVRYPASGFTTANEVHLPIGRDMLIGIESADVIHDFWVPRLGRKIDAIPGRRNFVWIRAEEAGEYAGACAEYCGAQHAWMRFRVDVQPPAAYDAWLTHQSAPAAEPATADAKLGQTLFGQLTCESCHNITGFHKQEPYAPDLTHVASRQMLAAERLENTPSNLRDWLHEPDVLKPGSFMPNLKLSDSDLSRLTAYLETLQ
ncbi:MAG TPA: cytochrome c oxidase subunit II [Bryobacteraceae bacterium]|nr:cytochrome c oxidase subunit II [Bryobacteraceae bacterium]